MPWGTYGYAQLSMGRDRYAEYAAQRLARKAVDRLLHGHYDPTDDSSADVQIRKRLENNAERTVQRLSSHLPPQGQASNWIREMFRGAIGSWTQQMSGTILEQIPNGHNKRGSEWSLEIDQALRAVSEQIENNSKKELYDGVTAWAGADGIQAFLLEMLKGEIAK